MRILFLGDIVGHPGKQMVEQWVPKLIKHFQPDITIANAENIAPNGRGLTERLAEALFDVEVDILTLGNHAFDHKESLPLISTDRRIVRPANYPAGTPGQGYTLCRAGNSQIAIINLLGRAFLGDYDDPFRTADRILEEIGDKTKHIFLDIHAEATSEKAALANYLAGRVSAVVGTHTHVQTADERILAGGTAFLTDVGMCGPYDSIIGFHKDGVIQKFLTQMPSRFEVPQGEAQLHGVYIETNDLGKAVSISRISITPDRPWNTNSDLKQF
ncbi:TIGR00282 family metallophosphoesterase [Tumebacillus algifaecis]|uniref:TIGR00282 family metallophosphoesterase n=1 Tax=Tumebacillus algifaecis TaxID=1214604 RepID=A0A223D1Y7_9BACL|nr:TIGR00282 family metallophosphoesterase [Tumebacillus algifaecis]ASS75561.1 TIGR00282 family metallophosphoesterase [Tumebacillus algifaecis]